MTDDEIGTAFTKATGWTRSFNSVAFKMFCLGAEMEREACAKVCESRGATLANSDLLAELIRMRSNND